MMHTHFIIRCVRDCNNEPHHGSLMHLSRYLFSFSLLYVLMMSSPDCSTFSFSGMCCFSVCVCVSLPHWSFSTRSSVRFCVVTLHTGASCQLLSQLTLVRLAPLTQQVEVISAPGLISLCLSISNMAESWIINMKRASGWIWSSQINSVTSNKWKK